MTKVKTLTISCADLGEDVTYVAYEDYAALKEERENWSNQCAALIKERDALAAENAALKELYQRVVRELDDTCFEIGMMRGEKSMEYLAPDTPATDAYANQLRAEGVEMFADNQMRVAERHDADNRPAWADERRLSAEQARAFAALLIGGSKS